MINRHKRQDKAAIMMVDTLAILLSFTLGIWIRYGTPMTFSMELLYGTMLLILILTYIAIFSLFDYYTDFFKRGFFAELTSVFQMNLILALCISGGLFFFKTGELYSRAFFFTFFFFNVWIDYIARQYLKVYLLAYYKKSGASNKIMIITTKDRALSLIDNMRNEKEWSIQVTSFAIVDEDMVGQVISDIPVIANKNNIFDVATKSVVDEVFISVPFNTSLDMDLEGMILDFESIGITVNLSISTFNLNLTEKTIKNFAGYNVLTFTTKVFNVGALFIKRLVDIAGSIVGILLTLIISLFVAPAILLESPGPLVFSQVRIGKNGRRFKIYKFRSMYRDAEARKQELMAKNEMQGLMFKMKQDPRVTRVGNFIRKTSIDELPQFFNVLKGDMSLVGTRPPTVDEFLQYEGRHKRRLSLKPGITGLWQVSGRSDIDNFEDVVKLDLEYIDNWSLLLDLKLLLKTFVDKLAESNHCRKLSWFLVVTCYVIDVSEKLNYVIQGGEKQCMATR